MEKRKRRIIILGAITFAIAVLGGISYWIYQRVETIKENKELSKQIPSYIHDFFDKKSASDYPLSPMKPNWKGRYLLFDEFANLSYNKKRNEELNTHKYFPNEEINGLVLVKPERKILGYYKSKDSDVENSANEAYQEFYVISYFDIKTETLIARDTIWGALPKKENQTVKTNTECFLLLVHLMRKN